MIDFNWGLRWGRLEKTGFIFKYGNPWNYPAQEFEELKTLTLAIFVSKDQKEYELKHSLADIAGALNISQVKKEQDAKTSKNMADFFKGPLA
jgi:hypothetical protein